VVLPPYSALVRPHPEGCVQFCWYKRDIDILKGVQQWSTKMMKAPQHLSNKEGLREVGLFTLEKRKLRVISSACIST